jgi:hypothetical protein
LDKTVIEGFFKLNPESQVTLKVSYSAPIEASPYRLLIQKQPGTKNSAAALTINNYPHAFTLDRDTTVIQELELE